MQIYMYFTCSVLHCLVVFDNLHEMKDRLYKGEVGGIALDAYQYFLLNKQFDEHYLAWRGFSSPINIGALIQGLNSEELTCIKEYASLSFYKLDKEMIDISLDSAHEKKECKEMPFNNPAFQLLLSSAQYYRIIFGSILISTLFLILLYDICQYFRNVKVYQAPTNQDADLEMGEREQNLLSDIPENGTRDISLH